MAEPFVLAGLPLRNRLVAVAHGLADVRDGAPTGSDAAYWRRLASGGAAMVITGGTVVAPESTLRQRYLTEAFRPEIRDALRRRARAIIGEGVVAISQLVHLGRETLGAGNHFFPVSAAAVRSPREPVAPRPLTTAEIRGVVEAFRISAANCVAAGYHGVELHAAHGYLLAQFLSPVTNARDDAYGGDLEGRAALLCEVIGAIRAEIGDLPIGVRLSAANGAEPELELDDVIGIAGHVAAVAPFDYLNVTTGVRNTYVPGMATDRPPLLESVPRLRVAAAVPLLVGQSFRTAGDIERALRLGADLVGMARPFIADPDVANKLLSGDERAVRPCTSCNEDCRTFEPTGLCTVNPELGPPGRPGRPAAPLVLAGGLDRRNGAGPGEGGRRGPVAVVGAGPAGMECAMTLARHGAAVTLFEARRWPGGQAALAGLAPQRGGWLRFVDYQRAQLADLGVPVHLGVSPSAADLEGFGAVVLATGAVERAPDLPGDLPRVSSTGFLRDRALAPRGGRVAVLDDGFGWWAGIGAVQAAIEGGAASVVLITPGAGFGAGLSPENRTQVLRQLAGAPLRVMPFSTVMRAAVAGGTVAGGTGTDDAGTGGVEVRGVLDGSTCSVRADLLVVVGERSARLPDLSPAGDRHVVAIGDCVVPRRMSHAIAEGRAAALALLRRPALSAAHP
jgi:2,4-dienoyl-CoA reductase (NADPH2)